MTTLFLQILISSVCLWICSQAVVQLPSFNSLKYYYPGYKHFGGRYRNRKLTKIIGVRSKYLLHDTSALRLSYAFNKIGSVHSLGKTAISLSINGKDSLAGRNGLQFIFHPISYGPYLADKYGFPKVSRVHTSDSLLAKMKFWGLQGVVRILTYTKIGNHPKGHVALWDCDHFHQTKDWMRGHTLLTVEFWLAPDSNCSNRTPTRILSQPWNTFKKHTPMLGIINVSKGSYGHIVNKTQKALTPTHKYYKKSKRPISNIGRKASPKKIYSRKPHRNSVLHLEMFKRNRTKKWKSNEWKQLRLRHKKLLS